MPDSQDAVALLPARGGSKRVPRKNVRPFLGVPLIERTIGTVLETGIFRRVVVSTDDDEVAEVATAAGAEVPFRRRAELADDHTGTRPVVQHALRWLEQDEGSLPDLACLVYATAVLTMPDDLVAARDQLVAGDMEFVFSAAAYPAPVHRAVRRRPDGGCELLWPEHVRTRSQDLPEAFHDVGQFYWGRSSAWLTTGSVFEARSALYEIPHWRVQDIDTHDDWKRAELLVRLLDGE